MNSRLRCVTIDATNLTHSAIVSAGAIPIPLGGSVVSNTCDGFGLTCLRTSGGRDTRPNVIMKPLETVLADWREKASTLRSVRHQHDADLIDAFCDDVARAAEDYMSFLSETDAMLRSGKSVGWLRARFAEWLEQGHAEKRKVVRYDRALVIPRRPDLEAARDAEKAPTQRSLRRSTAKPDKPWTYQAFNQALIRLEHRAGVPHVAYRAAHGFRRYVINEVNARTGNVVLAGQYVGDKDLRTLMRSYVRERPEELQRAVAEMEHTGVRETGASRNADATRAPEGALDTDLVRD